jgi:hypothetical protein
MIRTLRALVLFLLAALLVLMVGGAVLAGFLSVKAFGAAAAATGGLGLSFLFLSPFGEMLMMLPVYVPNKQAAPKDVASNPLREKPKRGFGSVIKGVGLVAIIWTGLFITLYLPFAAIYKRQIEKREVATATVIDSKIVEVSRRRNGIADVRATLTFDRHKDGHVVQRRVDNFNMGFAGNSDSRVTALLVAVHPQSCFAPVRVPLRRFWREHFFGFAITLVALSIGTFIFMLGHVYGDRS